MDRTMDGSIPGDLAVQAESANARRDRYEAVLQLALGAGKHGEHRDADAILRQFNGYSNSLLLYEIQAGIHAMTARKNGRSIDWEHAWLG